MALRLITTALLTICALVSSAPDALALDKAPRDVAERAERIARADEDVKTHLALRPGKYDVTTVVRVVGKHASLLSYPPGRYPVVEFVKDGKPRIFVFVDPHEDKVLNVMGQQVVVMPGKVPAAVPVLGNPWRTLPLLAGFALVLLLGPRERWYRWGVAPPLLLVAASYSWVLAAVIGRDHLRAWTIVQYAAPSIAIVVSACVLVFRARRRTTASAWNPVLSVPLAFIFVASGHVLQSWLASRVPSPIDVAYASSAGATLMAGGVTPYGNVQDLEGFLFEGDTYGPLSYLAYVPGVHFDGIHASILGTNVVLSLVVAALLVVLGHRAGSTRAGWWAAAAWSVCPMVVLGGAGGHNDIVVAVTTALLALVVSRPGWRGFVVALAAATKMLPVLLLAGQVQRGDDPPRTWMRSIGWFAVGTVVIWAIGFQDVHGLRDFIEGARFQADRDDIASIWGLTGSGPARYVLLVFAAAVATYTMIRWRRLDAWSGLALGVASLSFAMISLPQFWFTYVVWLVPPMLGLAVMEVRPSLDAVDQRRGAPASDESREPAREASSDMETSTSGTSHVT